MSDREREPEDEDGPEAPAPEALRPTGSRTTPVRLEYAVPWRDALERR